MGRYFTATLSPAASAIPTVTLAFAEPADNRQIVPDALASLAALNLPGGEGIHFTGPASLPVAMALAHAVAHRYGYVACFDPKLQGYVVAISHDPRHRPGDLLQHQ